MVKKHPNILDCIAGDLWSDEVANGPYQASHCAGYAIDTMRRYRFRALVALFAPRSVIQRWNDDSLDRAVGDL